MARKTVKLPSISRVEPDSTATLEIPVGPTYKNIHITASGTALAVGHFGRIDVLIDGKVVQTYKNLQRLLDLNGYYARSTDTVNDFLLHFFRGELEDLAYRRAPGIGTADVQTFHIEFKLEATAPADIAMTAHAETNPVPQNLGVFFKVREFPFSSSVSGDVEVDKLPRGAFYGAIHLFKADISKVEVEVDQVKIMDGTKTVLERFQKDASPRARVPVTAKATHIDWMLEGDLAQTIKTDNLQDFRLKLTLDTSGSVDIITETIDTLGG